MCIRDRENIEQRVPGLVEHLHLFVDAANELGLSVETVETKTLELMNRGKIKIRR